VQARLEKMQAHVVGLTARLQQVRLAVPLLQTQAGLLTQDQEMEGSTDGSDNH
jgi:hypothetical protein